MTQLIRTKKHQTLPLMKSDEGPEVLPDRPTELVKKTPHNNLTITKEQIYPSKKSGGLESKTEVYIGQRDIEDSASGFNTIQQCQEEEVK